MRLVAADASERRGRPGHRRPRQAEGHLTPRCVGRSCELDSAAEACGDSRSRRTAAEGCLASGLAVDACLGRAFVTAGAPVGQVVARYTDHDVVGLAAPQDVVAPPSSEMDGNARGTAEPDGHSDDVVARAAGRCPRRRTAQNTPRRSASGTRSSATPDLASRMRIAQCPATSHQGRNRNDQASEGQHPGCNGVSTSTDRRPAPPMRGSRLVADRRRVDHEPEAHVAALERRVRGVDIAGPYNFYLSSDVVVRAELEHVLGLGPAADVRATDTESRTNE
jgi:hypothetical protein